MECFYTIKGENGEGPQITLSQLTEHFYRTTSKLKNTKIFSSDELQRSTVKEIMVVYDENYQTTFLTKEEIKNGEVINKDAYIGAYEFISKPNNNLINLGANSDRLAPEYIIENRIVNYIKNEFNKNPDVQDVPEDPELNSLSKNKDINIDYIPKRVQNYYLVEIKNIIAFEEKTKSIGLGVHNVLDALIKSGGNSTSETVRLAIEQIITKENKEILEAFKDDWKKTMLDNVVKIYNDLRVKGSSILAETFIVSKAKAQAQIKGNIDAIVVDDNGTPHIYDFKVSKKAYDNWDTAKLVTADWQLALYRQLLGQHTDISSSSLNVVAIHLQETLNGFVMNYKIVDRMEENGSLQQFGSIQKLANKLIPIEIKVAFDPEKMKSLTESLNLIIPDYKIRLTGKSKDVESVIRYSLEVWEKKGELAFYNEFEVEGLPNGKIVVEPIRKDGTKKTKEEMLEELRQLVVPYVEFLRENDYIDLSRLKTKISNVMADPSKNSLNYKESLDNTLKGYLSGNYNIVKGSDELATLGILLFENKSNGNIVVFSVTANNFKAAYKNGLNYGDLEYVKAFAFLNEYYDELNLGSREIENIVIYNLDGQFPDPRPIHKKLDLYLTLADGKTKIKPKMAIENIVKSDKETSNLIDSTLRGMAMTDRTKIEQILGQNMLTTPWESLQLEKLKEAQKTMLEAFPAIREKTLKHNISFDNEVEYLYALMQVLILQKSEYTIEGDFLDMTKFSFTYGDIKSVLGSLYSKEQAQYNAAGQRILGIMGGLTVSTPDKISSRDLKNINRMLAGANQRISQLMYKESTEIAADTRDYFDKIGFSKTNQNLWGYAREKFSPLFVQDSNGEVSDEWKTKNPYAYDLANKMTDTERDYLKKMLFKIKKWELNLSESEIQRIDITSLETLGKTGGQRIIEAINSATGEYFKMPIVRSEALDRNGGLLNGGMKGIIQRSKDYLGEVYDLIDPREFSEEDLKNAKSVQLGLYEMYDVYGKQTDAFKKKALDKFGKKHYELNLDTIAHKVAFSKIKKKKLDLVLPTINSFVWSMKLTASKYTKDISDQLDYIVERLQLAAFDESMVGEEFKDVVTGISVLKRFTTAMMLGFRPVLMVKELTVGLFKGFSLASTQMFGKDLFTLKDLGKALVKLTTIDKKFSLEWNLIDGINNYYAFANMDVNSISKKLQTSRRGLSLGVGRWMYSTSTIPDYYNRLALFLAKMIHDGSYEAHSLNENGYIQYDATKDERYSYYFENRHKFRNSSGEYFPAEKNEKYNIQRQNYLLLVQELNQDRLGETKTPYTEDSVVDTAYSTRERNSFKTLTDTTYGYYDKDAQSSLHNNAFGMVFLQFMQFWPGKMNMWFGKPTSSGLDPNDSPMTRHVQKVRNGKKMWLETTYIDGDKEKGILGTKETEEDTGNPSMEIIGSPQEGLALSLLYTVQDVFKGNWEGAKNNEDRMARVYFALADAAMMMVFFGIIVAMLKAWIAENGTDELSGNTMQFLYEVNRRVLNEQNVYGSTIGAVSSVPAFLSFGRQVAGDVRDVMTGNAGIMNSLKQNVKAFELWDPE